MSPITEAESLQALDQIAAANREMADRVRAPGWYSWSLSLMLGGMAAVQAAPLPVILGYEVVFLIAMAVLVRAYRRHSGVWIPGYRAGRTRWVAIGGGVLLGTVMFGEMIVYRQTHIAAVCFGAAVLITLLTRLHCWVWEKAYRRDLGVA